MLSMDRELDFIKLKFREIGFRDNPLHMSPKEFTALARTKRLHLRGPHGVHVVAPSFVMALKWRHLKIASGEDVSLEFWDKEASSQFLHGLEEVHISCRAFVGPSCVQLALARCSLGKEAYCWGSQHSCFFSSFCPRDRRASSRFQLSMLCGCQACQSCLYCAGKLPEGSIMPKEECDYGY